MGHDPPFTQHTMFAVSKALFNGVCVKDIYARHIHSNKRKEENGLKSVPFFFFYCPCRGLVW